MEFQGDWTIRKSNPAAFLIASEVTTPGSPMAQIGEVCSPLRFKEKICLITNNFSDFNDCKQLFLLLIKKCYIYYLSFGAGEGT